MIFNGGAPNCIPCKGGGALIFPLFSHNAQLFRFISPGGEPSLKFSAVARQSILTRGDENAPAQGITQPSEFQKPATMLTAAPERGAR